MDKQNKDINPSENQNNDNNNSNLSKVYNEQENQNSINNQNDSFHNSENMREEQINDNSLKYWFNQELVETKRIKIKNLIAELATIEKEINKDDIEGIMKKQNEIIKKYMDEQKKEFENYFKMLEI